jgi:hypothetical protein
MVLDYIAEQKLVATSIFWVSSSGSPSVIKGGIYCSAGSPTCAA